MMFRSATSNGSSMPAHAKIWHGPHGFCARLAKCRSTTGLFIWRTADRVGLGERRKPQGDYFVRITMLIPATFGLILAASQASQVTAQAAPAAKPVPADPAAALAVEQGEGRAVANKLADDLVSSFVYRDQAKAY